MRKRLSAEFRPGAEPGGALAGLLEQAGGFASASGLAPPIRNKLAIVVEELASNAARHGGAMAVAVELSADDEGITLRFEDDGAPFDPTARAGFAGPDPRTGGGVGLELVLRWCDPVTYARDGRTNRLDLRLPR